MPERNTPEEYSVFQVLSSIVAVLMLFCILIWGGLWIQYGVRLRAENLRIANMTPAVRRAFELDIVRTTPNAGRAYPSGPVCFNQTHWTDPCMRGPL